jgi:uncharacterized protein (DUF2141 family)
MIKAIFTGIVIFFQANVLAQEISYPEREIKSSVFELVIEGISEQKGEIRIAVFNSEKDYKDKENPVHTVVIPVEENSVTWTQDSLPFGTYAIAVYHDKNVNGELDSNLLGIPKEAYGFSNNARGRFGPASWEDAHFEVSSEESTMAIKVE